MMKTRCGFGMDLYFNYWLMSIAISAFFLGMLAVTPASWRPDWRRFAMAAYFTLWIAPFILVPIHDTGMKNGWFNSVYQQLEDGSWRML